MDSGITFTIFRYLVKHPYVFPILMVIVTLSTIGTFILLDFLLYGQQATRIALDNATNKTIERNQYFQSFTSHARNILLSIRKSKMFHEYLQSPQDSDNIKELMLSLARSHRDIMQIRYIDANGWEKIRFDRMKPGVDPQPAKELQNKQNRYYFEESIDKPQKVWFSKLDLNVEHGQVETPFKPTYRAILPVIHHERFAGILIINFFAEEMLNSLFHTPLYESILVDSDGFILYHFQKTKQWSGYQKPPFTTEAKFMRALKTDYYRGEDFVARKMDMPFQNELIMILQLNQKYIYQQESRHRERLFFVSVLVILLAFFVTLIIHLFIRNLARQIRIQEEEFQKLQTKQKEQEVLLIQQSRMADMGNMISMIAHQWRQPISTIMGVMANMGDIIRQGSIDKKALQTMIRTTESTLIYMSHTIDDFRSFFSRSKETVPFNLLESILSAYRIISSQLEDHEIQTQLCFIEKSGKSPSIAIEEQLSTGITKPDYVTFGYPNEFQQVILNLLSNAKDALLDSQVPKNIMIILDNTQEHYEITVQDNGEGIDPTHLHQVFEPYFTTKELLNGTGLGLYMSKMIIEKSFRGHIRLESTLKEGTSIIISLKKNQEQEAA